jgi:hypothetical protein
VVNFDTELVDVTLSTAEKWRLRQRAGRSAGCSRRTYHLTRRDLDLRLGSRSSGVGDLAGSGGAGVIGWFPALPGLARGEVPERSNGAVSKCAWCHLNLSLCVPALR